MARHAAAGRASSSRTRPTPRPFISTATSPAWNLNEPRAFLQRLAPETAAMGEQFAVSLFSENGERSRAFEFYVRNLTETTRIARVVVTVHDCILGEWKIGKGVIFPSSEVGRRGHPRASRMSRLRQSFGVRSHARRCRTQSPRLLRCRYCNRAHWFSFDGTVRLVDTPNSDEAPAVKREAEEDWRR
jgi:hypothetical protein